MGLSKNWAWMVPLLLFINNKKTQNQLMLYFKAQMEWMRSYINWEFTKYARGCIGILEMATPLLYTRYFFN